jgi:excisionase family DNA binding protein
MKADRPPLSANDSYMTTRQAAELLGVTVRTVQLWVESGVLSAWKTHGGHRRVSRTSVEHLYAKRMGDTSKAKFAAVGLRPISERIFRVLVVDDDVMDREMLVALLRSWGLPLLVESSADGFAALLSIGQSRPDLVLADLEMPDMDGFRMIRHLRAAPDPYYVDLIAITGLGAAEIAERGGLPLDVPVLYKPIIPDQLRELVSLRLSAKASAASYSSAA